MADSNGGPSTITFGGYCLDVENLELRKHGIHIRLPHQSARVLSLLARRAKEVVTREELQQELWGEGTFVDYEHGLNNCIKQLRAALDDDADHPRYVETITKRGYRFIAPVEVGPRDGGFQGSGSGAHESLASVRIGQKAGVSATASLLIRSQISAVAILLVFVLGLAGYFAFVRYRAPGGEAKITQVSHLRRAMNGAKISPDGRLVAFVSPAGGYDQVFTILASGGETLQLTFDDGNKFVDSFSPAGTEIYYQRAGGMDEVWEVPVIGGPAHRVVYGIALVPSADGGSIFYIKRESLGLFRSPKSGLGEELVYSFKESGVTPWLIAPFPNGADLLVAARNYDATYGGTAYNLFKVNIGARTAEKLIEIAGANYDFVWEKPGKTLLFSRAVNGITNLWRYGLADRSLTQVTFGAGPDFSPMADSGRKGTFFVNGRSLGSLTVYTTQTKQSKEIETEITKQPLVSHDGRRVMYVTLPEPNRNDLWVSDIDGGNKIKIVSSENLGTADWSLDDSHLSFGELGSGGFKLYAVRADGSELRQIPFSKTYIGGVKWGGDGASFYVSGHEQDITKFSTWRLNVDGSNVSLLENGCGYVRDASPDGNFLIFRSRYGHGVGIYQLSLIDGKCRLLVPDVQSFEVRFARDGRAILYSVSSRDSVSIHRQAWRDGKIVGPDEIALQVPFSFPQDFQGNAYDFSRDLSSIVYARPGGQADLFLLNSN